MIDMLLKADDVIQDGDYIYVVDGKRYKAKYFIGSKVKDIQLKIDIPIDHCERPSKKFGLSEAQIKNWRIALSLTFDVSCLLWNENMIERTIEIMGLPMSKTPHFSNLEK
jgi:hypothetical protein